MNISKLLLSTSLLIMSCSNINAAEGSKTMYYDMLTSSYENLKNYKVNETKEIANPSDPGNVPNPLYGAIYDKRSDGNYYLVDENNNKFFDLQTRVNKITAKGQKLTNPEGGGGSP